MRIRLVEHAKERANERGASEDEIRVVLLKGQDVEVKKGRKGKELIFDYNAEWLWQALLSEEAEGSIC